MCVLRDMLIVLFAKSILHALKLGDHEIVLNLYIFALALVIFFNDRGNKLLENQALLGTVVSDLHLILKM